MGTHYSKNVEDPAAERDAALAKPTKAEQAVALGELLNAMPEFVARLRDLRQGVVKSMHDDDHMSWEEIGKAIGAHRNRAAQIAKGVTGGKKNRKDDSAPQPE